MRKEASEMISLRIPADQKDIIDTAVSISRKNRTEFLLESALMRAEEIILDQRFFVLDEEETEQLMKLATPTPEQEEKMAALLNSKDPWEE